MRFLNPKWDEGGESGKRGMSHSPKYTQISTDVALRDIVNKRSTGSGFEAGIGLIRHC
jgi:hypothetical protein